MLAICPTLPVVGVIHRNLPGSPDLRVFHQNDDTANDHALSIHASSLLCADPMPGESRRCEELEQQFLASTVRLEWHLWIMNDDDNRYSNVKRSVGHATIKEGRYLVTHNHPGMLRSDLENGQYITASVFSANGEPIWLEVPLSLLSIVVEEPGTLVIEFGNYVGRGPFVTTGLASADFITWESLPLQPGMEVAQVGWDGATAYIDWVMINEVMIESGSPRIELANFVTPGTSGGGIFWNGYHIANTWYQATELDPKSEVVLRQYSVAALNSPQVTATRQEVQADELKYLEHITRESGQPGNTASGCRTDSTRLASQTQ